MNFFAAQSQARRRTKWLILWFALGVLGTVACLYVGAILASHWLGALSSPQIQWTGNPLALWTAVAGLVIIPLGSGFKLMQLSQGGSVVARDLGARLVDHATREFSERRLLNVVEEMSIASGIPMPQVWVMDDEPSINAFAAGTEPSNAVIGVSRGCLEKLTRAELQGVVAHEFSHILNGDMRLNLRLIGWLFGLLMIAMLGRGILSMLRHVRVRSSGDNKNGGGLILVVLLAGVCLWLIGSLGVLFGRIIQAAVSRQREYLADASAVQFTRDPSGIAGALKKIAQMPQQRMLAPRATEAAHLFFSGAVGDFFSGLMATHPPLVKRIAAIDASWEGGLLDADKPAGQKNLTSSQQSGISSLAPVNLAAAAEMRDQMAAQGSIATVAEAKGLLLALVSASGSDQGAGGETTWSAEEKMAWEQWHEQCRHMSSAQKIAWMDLALPLLRQMSQQEYRDFRAMLKEWTERDQQITLFEWMLHHAIQRHMMGCYERADETPVRWYLMAQVEDAVAALFACFCSLSADAQTWQRCAAEYQRRIGRSLPQVPADFQNLSQALHMMAQASAEVKQQIIEFGQWLILSDGVQNDPEIELLRATADAIGAVLPP
jgi:Zn-dependent protease with chaperone function